MSKTLSKYIADCDYLEQTLLVLSTASGDVSIALFATIIGVLVGITPAKLGLVFSVSDRI